MAPVGIITCCTLAFFAGMNTATAETPAGRAASWAVIAAAAFGAGWFGTQL